MYLPLTDRYPTSVNESPIVVEAVVTTDQSDHTSHPSLRGNHNSQLHNDHRKKFAHQTGNTWTVPYDIIIATGGGGAPSHGPYQAGTAGAAGIVTNGSGKSLIDGTEPSYKGEKWW